MFKIGTRFSYKQSPKVVWEIIELKKDGIIKIHVDKGVPDFSHKTYISYVQLENWGYNII